MPWSTPRHRTRTVGDEAWALGLAAGVPCLEILRATRIDRRWVTRVRQVYPGEAHQLLAEFETRAAADRDRL